MAKFALVFQQSRGFQLRSTAYDILQEAESVAASGDLLATLRSLRRLSLDDFGDVMFSMPMDDFPALSELLPKMVSSEVQKTWTGAEGLDLLTQTIAFMRQLEAIYARHRGRPLSGGETVLDFGCGYGRLLRMMLYYTNPENIWGVDAWDSSLRLSRESGVLANLHKSDVTPLRLPTGGQRFDFAYAFSVFTHLSPGTAVAALAAIRASMNHGGIFVATTRPVEYWSFRDRVRGTDLADQYEAEHAAKGFAYMPDENNPDSNYGAFSARLEWFEQAGWKLLGYDSLVSEPVQVSVILQAV